jgi:hypothetical protein
MTHGSAKADLHYDSGTLWIAGKGLQQLRTVIANRAASFIVGSVSQAFGLDVPPGMLG